MATLTTNNAINGLSEGGTINSAAAQGVLATDTDPFGFPLAVNSVSIGGVTTSLTGASAVITGVYGILTMQADGGYSYTAFNNVALPADGIVQDKFTFSVADGHGNTGQATLTVTVTQTGVDYIAAAAGQTVTVGNRPTVVDASLGNVTVKAGNGNDVVIGGMNDTISLGKGNDTIVGGTNEKITVGNGNDTITAGSASTVTAGNGADSVTVGNNSSITVGNGNDVLVAGSSATIHAGNGTDTVSAGASSKIGVGTGSDTITAGAGSTVTAGNAGTVSPSLSIPSTLSVSEDGSLPIPITVSGSPGEIVTVKISGIPADASLSNNSGALTVVNGGITLSPAQLVGLTLNPPPELTGTFGLTVIATDTESSSNTQASTTQTVAVTINPVAEAPSLSVVSPLLVATGTTLIPLEINAAQAESDLNSGNLNIAVTGMPPGASLLDAVTNTPVDPNNISLSQIGDGLIFFDPAGITSPPVVSLTVVATDTEPSSGTQASASQSVTVTDKPVAEPPIITVEPVLPVPTGTTLIPLGINVVQAESDLDPANLNISVAGLPTGTSLVDSVTGIPVDPVNLTQSQIRDVSFFDPAGITSVVSLTVTANDAEPSGTVASASQTVVISPAVTPAPALSMLAATGTTTIQTTTTDPPIGGQLLGGAPPTSPPPGLDHVVALFNQFMAAGFPEQHGGSITTNALSQVTTNEQQFLANPHHG